LLDPPSLFSRGPVGWQWKGAPLPGTLSQSCDFVSLGEFVYWGLRKIRKTMLGQLASLSVETSWVGGHLPRTLKGMWDFVLMKDLVY
jgi:hypothetical protein